MNQLALSLFFLSAVGVFLAIILRCFLAGCKCC
jgi:hypothetical protein